MEMDEGSDGKMEEEENGMGGQWGLWRGHCWGHLSPPALSQGRIHPRAAAGPCQGHSRGVGTAPMAQHTPDVLSPRPGAPPRPLDMGRDPAHAWLCLWHCPCVPKDEFRGTIALLPGSPWLWWPSPKVPRLWGQLVGGTQEQEDI